MKTLQPVREFNNPDLGYCIGNLSRLETILRQLIYNRVIIEVEQLPNEEDCAFVFGKRLHVHNDMLCTECTVMAVF